MKHKRLWIALVAVALILCLAVGVFLLIRPAGVRDFRTLTILYNEHDAPYNTVEIVIDARRGMAYIAVWPGGDSRAVELDETALAAYRDFVYRATHTLHSEDYNPESGDTGALRLWEIRATDAFFIFDTACMEAVIFRP